jgi:hypothetical protein
MKGEDALAKVSLVSYQLKFYSRETGLGTTLMKFEPLADKVSNKTNKQHPKGNVVG